MRHRTAPGGEAGHRTAHNVADVVHAGLQAGEADLLQPGEDFWDVLDPHAAQLDLLASGEVSKAGPKRVGDLGQSTHLRGRCDAVGDANAHHEEAGRMAAEEHAVPLHQRLVPLADRLRPFAAVALDVFENIQPIFLFLVFLDLVHGLPAIPRLPEERGTQRMRHGREHGPETG